MPLALLLLCATLYLVTPLPVVAIVASVVIFLIVLWKPAWWLAITFAGGVLPQSLLGENAPILISFSDVMALLLLIILGIFTAGRRVQPTFGPLQIPLLLFLVAMIIASIAHWRGLEAIVSLARILEYVFGTTLVFAAFVRSPQDADRCFLWLIAVEVFLGIAALVGFATGATKGLYILNMHKNSIGPSLACGVVVSLIYLRSAGITSRMKVWFACALTLTLIGVIFSLSRGSWAAAIGATLVVLALRRDVRGLALITGLAVPLFTACWILLPDESAKYAGDISLGSHTMQIRFDNQARALDLFKENPLLGTGIGLRKENDPENVYILTLAETGLVGLTCFLFLIGSFYWLVLRLANQLTPSKLCSSPAGRVVLCCAGIFTVTIIHGATDVYWRRGVVFVAWAAAGLCISLWRYLRQQAVTGKEQLLQSKGFNRHVA